jgi:rhodanese-related sulfurtransferase
MVRLAPFATLALLTAIACGGAPATAPSTVSAPTTPPTQVVAPAGAVRHIDVATFKAERDAGKVPVLIDVRTPQEFAEGHVEGAILLPLQELEQRLADVEPYRGSDVYVICKSGGRSARAAAILNAKGYKAINVQGGTMGWIDAGNPVVQ